MLIHTFSNANQNIAFVNILIISVMLIVVAVPEGLCLNVDFYIPYSFILTVGLPLAVILDIVLTARSIATQCGIFTEGSIIMTGWRSFLGYQFWPLPHQKTRKFS